jgi:hypothetical protein
MKSSLLGRRNFMGQDPWGGSQDAANYIPIALKPYRKSGGGQKGQFFWNGKALAEVHREKPNSQKMGPEMYIALYSRTAFQGDLLFKSKPQSGEKIGSEFLGLEKERGPRCLTHLGPSMRTHMLNNTDDLGF